MKRRRKQAGVEQGVLWERVREPVWQRRFYDFNVWSARKHVGRNLGTDGTFTGFCELELGVRPACPQIFGGQVIPVAGFRERMGGRLMRAFSILASRQRVRCSQVRCADVRQ